MDDDRLEVLRDFVLRNGPPGAKSEVGPHTRILSEGLLDSMGVSLFAAFIEESFGVPFDDTELKPGTCETIADILAAVDRRR